MAKLNALPDQQVISALNGLVDFYYWKGIPVARRWPQHTPRDATAAEAAGQLRFSTIAKMTGLVADSIKVTLQEQPLGDTWTWVDRFRAVGLQGLAFELGQPG